MQTWPEVLAVALQIRLQDQVRPIKAMTEAPGIHTAAVAAVALELLAEPLPQHHLTTNPEQVVQVLPLLLPVLP